MALLSSTLPAELGPFVTPHFLKWRRNLHREHTMHFKSCAEFRTQLREIDLHLRAEKETSTPDVVRKKIKKRKKIHQKLKERELKFFDYNKIWVGIEDTIDKAIADYSRSSCTQLITQMHSRLPQELRDMVYEHLLDPPSLELVARQVRLHWEDPNHEVEMHWLNPSFVTKNFLHNVLAITAFRRNTPDYYQHKVDIDDLEEFLNATAFSTDIPICYYFGKLEIVINFPALLEEWNLTEDPKELTDARSRELEHYIHHTISTIPVLARQSLEVHLLFRNYSHDQANICKRLLGPMCWDLQKRTRNKEFVHTYLKVPSTKCCGSCRGGHFNHTTFYLDGDEPFDVERTVQCRRHLNVRGS